MTRISFMIANYLARQVDYNMTGGWGQGENAAYDYFRPVETFGARFEEWEAIDMWTGVLHPEWATDEHLAQARDLLRKHDMAAYSYGGWIGSAPEYFTRMCDIATALDIPVLGGAPSMVVEDRNFVVDALKSYRLLLGIENHPEKSVDELLAKVGDGGDGTIGAAGRPRS